MSVSRLVETLCRYVNDELQSGKKLVQVVVPTSQEELWTWCFLLFDHLDSADPIPPLPPMNLSKGEMFGASGSSTFYSALEDFVCSQLPREALSEPAVLQPMSTYVRQKLADPAPNPPFLFLRLKPDPQPLDADAVALELRRLTWLRFRSLPPALAKRKVEIEVGAHRAPVAPSLEPPDVQFEVAGSYFAGYVLPGVRAGIKYNVCGRDGAVHTFTINLDVFLELIGFPIQESYGYEFALPLEFDALLANCDNIEKTVQESLAQMPTTAKDKLFELVREQIGKVKQEYMRRLDERRQALKQRKPIYLGEQWLGYAPEGENEVLILAGKLEAALSKHLAEFLILEHTKQIDIDGMVRIRRHAGLLLEETATVEFEFKLDNFFKHKHPTSITNYIICWSMGPLQDGTFRFGHKGLNPDGPLSVEVSTTGWIRVLTFQEHMIYVLPLEHFPGLGNMPVNPGP
jgi:hypothetical protein